MKRFFFIVSLVLFSSTVVFSQQERESRSSDEMAFETLSHDYGSIVYGADGSYKFVFKNNSQKPLVITNVKSSCGCTVPSWPKEPIQPGDSGSITVKYNTKLPGTFNKSVQVFSTADNSPVKLSIRGKVNAKPSDIKSDNSGNRLMNGTGIKEGVRQENTQTLESQEMTASEEKIIGGTAEISKLKKAKKEAYLKQKEAEKKKK